MKPWQGELLEQLLTLVQQAGELMLPLWRTELAVESKSDNSPVTQADLLSHRCIVQGLQRLAPEIPVLSEEDCGISAQERSAWQRWWLVDPLDGTKEFIAGSEEFTVNIALIEQGKVLFGIVGVPARAALFWGGAGLGSFCRQAEVTKQLRVATPANPLRVMVSRRHSSQQQQEFMRLLEQQQSIELLQVGSSLKFCMLAQGGADLYARFAPTSQWDTAAGQAVLEGAGGAVVDASGRRLLYAATEEHLNPHFVAATSSSLLAQLLSAS